MVSRSEGRRRSMSSGAESRPLSQSSETYVRHPIAIAILGYDRPHYLTQVLDSLAPQLSELDQVYLFQDGAWNPHSGITKTDPELIEECCMVFSRITFYVHEYLIRLLPEEVEAMTPPHLRGSVSP